MEQKEFTDYIIPKMIERFPQFRELCEDKPNDITDINYKSDKGKITFWITTQYREITLGFTGDSDCDWHTHMSLFGAETPDEELAAACAFIDDIINDRMKIIHSSIVGYYPTNNVEEEIANKMNEEIFEIFNWSDL